jgi:hypothetical protein
LSWGPCDESGIPADCIPLGSTYDAEAEQCCIDAGFCCQDYWDIDFDGDRDESLGDCVDIVCE